MNGPSIEEVVKRIPGWPKRTLPPFFFLYEQDGGWVYNVFWSKRKIAEKTGFGTREQAFEAACKAREDCMTALLRGEHGGLNGRTK